MAVKVKEEVLQVMDAPLDTGAQMVQVFLPVDESLTPRDKQEMTVSVAVNGRETILRKDEVQAIPLNVYLVARERFTNLRIV